jgi:hypothetical protein
MFSRFLAGNVPTSTRWAKNSPAKMRAGRARRDYVVASIINSLSKADLVSLLVEPLAMDGKPLDFRTSKVNQYSINVFGTPFRVSKANGQPVYRLSAVENDLTLFVLP